MTKVVSTKGTEIILLEGALLVFPTEVRVAEVDACGNRPVLGVAGLPFGEILLHWVARHVPRKHIVDGVALVSTDPKASWTVSGEVVQVHHIHLLVKAC